MLLLRQRDGVEVEARASAVVFRNAVVFWNRHTTPTGRTGECHFPNSLIRSFLRVWVCVLTIVIPDDLKHAPVCDSPGEISARSVHFAVR